MSDKIINTSSSLEIIIGPMFSGKSTELIRRIKLHQVLDIKTIVINSSCDSRCNNEIMTHDKKVIQAIKLEKLMETKSFLNEIIEKYQLIAVDEAQFFPDLIEFTHKMLKYKKKIIIAGLKSDSENRKFGQIIDLIPICDRLEFLTGLCIKCRNGMPGSHSLRLNQDKSQTYIGSSESYQCVCRQCLE